MTMVVMLQLSSWLIFENTHEAIITQQEFDLVQELRKNKRRPTKHEEVNPFSGICYCADCGKKLYLCRATTMTADQEHLKCGTYGVFSGFGSTVTIKGSALRPRKPEAND